MDSVRCDMSGKEVIVNPIITEEYVVLGQVGDYTQTDFCEPGDSSSVLMDRWGRICGLPYGFTSTYGGIDSNLYAGLAMTMSGIHGTVKIKSRGNDGQSAVLVL